MYTVLVVKLVVFVGVIMMVGCVLMMYAVLFTGTVIMLVIFVVCPNFSSSSVSRFRNSTHIRIDRSHGMRSDRWNHHSSPNRWFRWRGRTRWWR